MTSTSPEGDPFPTTELDATEDNGRDTLDEATDPDDAAAPREPRPAGDGG
jgi:hypothetical protein